MSAISRYIFIQVLTLTLGIAGTFTLAVWLAQSLRYVDFIVNRGLPVTMFFYLTILLLPQFLLIVLPLGFFVALLFVYSRLISDNELIVLRAVGFSEWRLIKPMLTLALLITLILYGLNTYLIPLSFRSFKDLEFDLRNNFAHVVLQEGTFKELMPGLTIFVRNRDRNGTLAGLLVHDSRDPNTPITYLAETGTVVKTEGNPRVVLVDGSFQKVDRDNKTGAITGLSMVYFERYTLELNFDQGDATLNRWREPPERYMHELFRPPQNSDDKNYRNNLLAEGHQRLVYPWLTVVFTVITLAALLHGDFNRKGHSHRIIGAILGVIIVQSFALALPNIATKIPSLTILMYLNILMPLVAAISFLYIRPKRKLGTTAQIPG
ncbi:MAG: LPS export ABC transporter permease LptF [Alphaproteobacteria bacterium]